MYGLWKDIGISLMLGMVLPGMLLGAATAVLDPQPEELAVVTIPVQTKPELPDETTSARPLAVLCRMDGGLIREMEMDSYLVGVVLAEMPAYFEQEALKAQAVGARTYALKAGNTGGKHGDGSVCTNPGCCQAYISEKDYLTEGGKHEDLEKVKHCVLATTGQVLTYGGNLIEATYFSCSGGSTEDAAAVWGTAFPYLKAVESPGEESAAFYTDTVRFSRDEFCGRLGTALTGNPATWFGPVTKTAGDGVEAIVIGGKTYSGVQLRTLLELKSTAFTVDADGDGVSITTRGFGHRVGMSQYGADAMAVEGNSFSEILAHYYPGTVLQCLQT